MSPANANATLLVFAVAAVGVFHTCVPDHWVPIALIARQRGWSRRVAARVAAGAGLGHTLSTLAIAIVFWVAGAVLASRVGHLANLVASLALIAFGGWIAIGALLELRRDPSQSDGARVSRGGERTALMFILGSSPMVEGIPAFFAAARFGIGQLVLMSVVFAVATIVTYVGLVLVSLLGFERLALGPLERYGEVFSGGIVAALGIFFLFFPL